MSYVMVFVGQAGTFGSPDAHPFNPSYLKAYDPEAFGGRGDVKATRVLADAQRFETMEAAVALWRTVPRARPVRPDGQPNRPLCALSVSIVPVEQAAETLAMADLTHRAGGP
jgi:hypothetical protein